MTTITVHSVRIQAFEYIRLNVYRLIYWMSPLECESEVEINLRTPLFEIDETNQLHNLFVRKMIGAHIGPLLTKVMRHLETRYEMTNPFRDSDFRIYK
jgi:hypothetical protein